ncbi:uncharacterized protein V6R79_014889 [Siganus canaliculatus]
MDASLFCIDNQTQPPAAFTELDSDSLLHSLTQNMLSTYETGPETVQDHMQPIEASAETLSNISKSISQEKSAESLSLCPEPDGCSVYSYFSSSPPALPLLPPLSHQLISPFAVEEPALSFPLMCENKAPQAVMALASASDVLMESSFPEPLLRSLSRHSDSSESDSAPVPMSDLYIFESETQEFILKPNTDPEEKMPPEYQRSSPKEGIRAAPDCDTRVLISDSENLVTHCHRHASEEPAMLDLDSDMSQQETVKTPAVDACEAGFMPVSDVRQVKAEVTDLTLQPWRGSGSPVELWLDACQYLAGEDTEGRDCLERTSQSVMQEGLLDSSDSSFPARETRVSSYKSDASEGIGWSGNDTGGWGRPVERWSSVDSWESALSDWAGIIAAPLEDFTAAFTEIGAEIDALTKALTEVNANIDTESSKEAEPAVQEQPQPTMGVQDQPLKAQSIPESSVLSGQRCASLCLDAAGPELQDGEGFQCVEPLQDATSAAEGEAGEIHSEPGEVTSQQSFMGVCEASPGDLHVDASAHLDFAAFGGFIEDFETDLLLRNESHPIILNIVEDTDLEGEYTTGEQITQEPVADGLCQVTKDQGVSQLDSEQEPKRSCCGPVEVEAADFPFFTTQRLTDSHVPGVDTHVNVGAHVSSDTAPGFDGTSQLEAERGSPKFITPLAPLCIGSPFLCQTSSNLKTDQTFAQRSLNDSGELSCVLWPTSNGITDKSSVERGEELIHKQENTTGSSEKSYLEGQLDSDNAECSVTERKTVIDEIHELGRELSNLAVIPADHFSISEEDRVAVITLDLNDPFVSTVAKTTEAAGASEKPELNQETAEKMPQKTHRSSEVKPRCKKDKPAGHHYGAQASKKQENLPQICKQLESLGNHSSESAPVATDDKEAKLVIESSVANEKAPNKQHSKKKKKHSSNVTGAKSAGEPLGEVENGAKPKTTKGKTEMFEAKLVAKVGKPQKDCHQSHGAEKKASLQPEEAKVSHGEQPPRKTDQNDHQPRDFTPLTEDIIKKPRLSGEKFGKIVSVLEAKLPKPDISLQAKAEEAKVDAGVTRRKAYSEVVKQNIAPKEEAKVVKPIQATAVSGDPQSLCLWCQFSAVLTSHTVTWSRDGTILAETTRSAGDESRASLNISNASHKDLGRYQCRLTSSQGSVTLDFLLTYELLSQIVIPLSPTAPQSAPVEVDTEEEDVQCSRLMFREDFLSDQFFGENQPVSIITEKVHFGEGMHRRAFRTKLHTGEVTRLVPGHSCVLKVHNAISYGTNNNDELIQKNFNLAVEECQVQNTAREYIKAYSTAAQSVEAFGDTPDIIPIYLVHRPSNDIPYATLEEELIGDFVKYSVKDGKEINLLRRDSEAGQKCCAFQHWVYHNTEGNLLVTDMQGVGMRLTDVGIATCKKGYKGFKGNCATSFIDQFKALHQCNKYCEILGLKSLQPKPKKPASAPKAKAQPSAAPKKKTFGPTVKNKS